MVIGHATHIAFDWPGWITAISTAVLAIGVFFAWYALRDARKTRHAELVADFSRRWDSQEIHDSCLLGREYGPEWLVALTDKLWGEGITTPKQENITIWYAVQKWPNLLETIGVLASDGALPTDVVYRMWGGQIIDAWRDWRDAVYNHRGRIGDPAIWQYFEWLADEMEKKRAKEALLRFL